MATPAFLAVFSTPGPQVPLNQFHDWYDNEHVPLRINNIPSFLTATRYARIPPPHDSPTAAHSPEWLAMYSVSNTDIFQDSSYTRLRSHRSPREAALVLKLLLLDRRTTTVVHDTNPQADFGEGRKAASWMATVAFDVNDAVDTNTDDHDRRGADEIASVWATFSPATKMEGWFRTRVVKCIDTLVSGTFASTAAAAGEDVQKVQKYLAVHEFSTEPPSNVSNLSTVFTVNAIVNVDEKYWKLYRDWPKGNPPS